VFTSASQKRAADSLLVRLIKHLPEQSPNFYHSYSGITYQKIRIFSSAKPESWPTKPTENTNNLLYSIESLVQVKMLKPAYYHIENLSIKTEGTENDLFKNICNQLNTVSITDTVINVFNKRYLTPFSKTGSVRYNFNLSDSITQSGDTLYWLGFDPKPEKEFDGFRGKALADPKNFTFRKIVALSTQKKEHEPNLLITQNFEQIQGKVLPAEIKISAFLNKEYIEDQNIKNKDIPDYICVETVSNIYQQQIDPILKPADFTTSVQPNDSAVLDYLKKRQLKMIRMFAEGKVSLGSVDLNYSRLFGYNLYEGVKLGLEAESNLELSNYFSIGGYFSYGFKDQSIRHGEWVNIYPSGSLKFRIHLGYKDRNVEYGEPEFLENQSLLNPESYRTLLIKNMYSTKRFTTGIEYSSSDELNFFLFTDQSENGARNNSPFLLAHPFSPITLARTGLQISYSPVRKIHPEDGQPQEPTKPSPEFYLTMIQGLAAFDNQYQYSKIEFKGKFDLPFSKIGTTTILLRGGLMTNDAPLIEYFNGYGSFAGNFSLSAPYSFATMQLNEYASTRFAAVHLRHNFSKWMFPENFKTRPSVIFAQNIGVGVLDEKYKDLFNFKDYRKGFYESGIEINNLLRVGYISWGAGIYYRYGPYRFNSIHDNFAYKFGFLITI